MKRSERLAEFHKLAEQNEELVWSDVKDLLQQIKDKLISIQDKDDVAECLAYIRGANNLAREKLQELTQTLLPPEEF